MGDVLPRAAGIDAAGALLSIALYLLVGAAVAARFPRDLRARLFLIVALCNVAPAGSTVLSWRSGAETAFSRTVIAAVLASLALGSIALFHFAQTFPGRRPWTLRHGRWLPILYCVTPLVAIALVAAAPADVADLPLAYAMALLILGLPWIFLVLVVLPFAGLLSLYASWREARDEGKREAARVTLWILISQIAGGVLGLIVIPLLRGLTPGSPLGTIASVLLVGCGLLMPGAVAVAAWRTTLFGAPAPV